MCELELEWLSGTNIINHHNFKLGKLNMLIQSLYHRSERV